MEITYQLNAAITVNQIVDLYSRSGLPRPVSDTIRMEKMFLNSDLVMSAWSDGKLAGICRCITDWEWCCYVPDLAVDPQFQRSGIGKRLIEVVRETIGDRAMILLLSVPDAMTYYPKIGFTKDDRCFTINRAR